MSCLFLSEIFNTKLNRYPKDALYLRRESRSCEILRTTGKVKHVDKADIVNGAQAKHIKIGKGPKKYLHRNTHLEGKKTMPGLLGSCNGKWQGFLLV